MAFDEKKDKKQHNFELLAPAGSFEIFKAVIAAGADAVYVGGNRFGARAYASNFSETELLETIDYAHLHRRRVYLTVNTLLKNTEISQLYDYLLPYYERGLDAVLVQDIGVFRFIKEFFPALPIHTSTQMTVTSAEDAKFLKELGADRIVLARELSLREMKKIHEETGMELEAFVHGAHCYSYSGQCLFSSILGGRSGNRGRCAQPCRLPYTVSGKDSYVLSLKDLCGIADLNKLYEAGVYSLKIEGRMKQLAYAAGVVSVYRKYIDTFLQNPLSEYQVAESDKEHLMDLGNRCGFTSGYYHDKKGPDMVTFTKPSYEKNEQPSAGWQEREDKIAVDARVHLLKNQPAIMELSIGDTTVSVSGMKVMEAKTKPLTATDVKNRMGKTGGTPFMIRSIKTDLEEGAFLPNGVLNQLRRDTFLRLQEELLQPYRRTAVPCRPQPPYNTLKKIRSRISCLTENRKLLPFILKQDFVTTVYLDYGAYQNEMTVQLKEDVSAIKATGKEAFFAMPRIFRQHTIEQFNGIIGDLKQIPFDGFLVRTYGEIRYLKQHFPYALLVADHNLYTYNDTAVKILEENGLYNTMPLELNKKEIAHRDNHASEIIVYGSYPLMVSAQCVHANTKGCNHTAEICQLTDRKNTVFPVKNYCNACYNVLYNSLPVILFSSLGELKEAGIQNFRLEFTVEDEKQTAEILSLFRDFIEGKRREMPSQYQNHYTNGHYKRGVE